MKRKRKTQVCMLLDAVDVEGDHVVNCLFISSDGRKRRKAATIHRGGNLTPTGERFLRLGMKRGPVKVRWATSVERKMLYRGYLWNE